MPKQKKLYLNDIQDKLKNPYLTYFSNFYDEKEQALLKPILNKSKRIYKFDGGYPEAQRKMLILYSEFDDKEFVEPPMSALVFKKPCELTHRNVLGTILSLGVNRDTIGDITIFDDFVQIIIQKHLGEYFLSNFRYINNHRVEPDLFEYHDIIPYSFKFDLETCTASSNRLDAVIASIFKTSRKKAIEFIKQGLILHNHLPLKKYTSPVEVNDTLSMRGKGKVKITSFGSKTKKGRIRINYKKYK